MEPIGRSFPETCTEALFVLQNVERKGISPKESDKTAGPLGTRVFTVHRRFCRYFLTPTKQITTKLVFVVSDHYSFVVISVFCRLYLHHYRTSGKKT
jgi:hypothetical protein